MPEFSMERTVAVVDDDEAVRASLSALLVSVGLAVRTYCCGSDFLGAPHAAPVDCLIVDLRMPGMSGLEMVDRLAMRGVRIPAVLISGNCSDATLARARRAGIEEYLEKPFLADALLDAVRRALD